MKRVVIILTLVLFIVGAGYGLGVYYKYDIYHMAMSIEKEKAQLTSGQISVDGNDFSYLEGPIIEDKPTLLLIHGFAASKENWLRFAANLTGQYHVIALDLLGHGESTKDLDLHYDIDDQVRYLQGFLAAKGIDRMHLVGNSMGGAIVSLYAATYPDRVETVSLVNPAGIHTHRAKMHDYLDKGQNPLVVKSAGDINTLMAFTMVDAPFIPWPITRVLAERSIDNQQINERIFDAISSEHKFNFEESLTRIKAPTLIMWGDSDKVIHYKNAEFFDQLIPNSSLLIYKNIGHMPMIEIPRRSAKDIDQFINKHS